MDDEETGRKGNHYGGLELFGKVIGESMRYLGGLSVFAYALASESSWNYTSAADTGASFLAGGILYVTGTMTSRVADQARQERVERGYN